MPTLSLEGPEETSKRGSSHRAAPQRDRVLDLLRWFSMIVIVAYHAFGLVPGSDPSGPFGHVAWTRWLTWGFEVMPVFFFAGAAASLGSWRAGSSWGGFLLRRVQRLYRPVFPYLVFWAVVLGIVAMAVPSVEGTVASRAVSPLWFVGTYSMTLALMPLLARIGSPMTLAATVAALYVAVAGLDSLGDPAGPLQWLVFSKYLLVWLIPSAMGIGYSRGLVSRGAGLAVAGVFLAVNLALCLGGGYSNFMFDGQTPPLTAADQPLRSLVLAGHGIVLSGLVIFAAPWLRRLAQQPKVSGFVAWGNAGQMTLYIWHWAVNELAADISRATGIGVVGYESPWFWPLQLLRTAVVVGVSLALIPALRPFEHQPTPGWDAPVARLDSGKSAVVGALVVIASVATLRWAIVGLVNTGLLFLAVALTALVVARALGAERRT